MNKENNLTEKQLQIFKFIYRSIQENNLPPTNREIADYFNVSLGTIQDHIKALVKKGFLSITKNASRGISLVRERLFKIPVLGRVQAGNPILAVEELEGYLDLDEIMFPDKDVFALRVKGDSMIGAGIVEGDFIIVKKQEYASPKDIVVALIGEEVTVKTLNKRNNEYFLDPANDAYQPIPLDGEVSIIGKVIKVMRNYN